MNKKHRKGYRRNKKIKEQESLEQRRYSNVLLKMIEVYQPQEEDWMGFKLSANNPYTFHHIRERRIGGKEELENGAILTLQGHKFLNHLDAHNHQAYEAYQEIFRRINKSRGPIDDELLEDIYGLMLDVFYYNIYHISEEALAVYERFTEAKPKKLIKKL